MQGLDRCAPKQWNIGRYIHTACYWKGYSWTDLNRSAGMASIGFWISLIPYLVRNTHFSLSLALLWMSTMNRRDCTSVRGSPLSVGLSSLSTFSKDHKHFIIRAMNKVAYSKTQPRNILTIHIRQYLRAAPPKWLTISEARGLSASAHINGATSNTGQLWRAS